MIRCNVDMLGISIDILVWDGYRVEELMAFGPDEFDFVDDEDGTAWIGSMHAGNRCVRVGDVLIRPAGRADISPLHLYHDSWWAQALGVVDKP